MAGAPGSFRMGLGQEDQGLRGLELSAPFINLQERGAVPAEDGAREKLLNIEI